MVLSPSKSPVPLLCPRGPSAAGRALSGCTVRKASPAVGPAVWGPSSPHPSSLLLSFPLSLPGKLTDHTGHHVLVSVTKYNGVGGKAMGCLSLKAQWEILEGKQLGDEGDTGVHQQPAASLRLRPPHVPEPVALACHSNCCSQQGISNYSADLLVQLTI